MTQRGYASLNEILQITIQVSQKECKANALRIPKSIRRELSH